MSGSEDRPNLDAYIKRRRRRRMAGILLVLLLAAVPIAVLISSRAFDIAVTPPKASASASWSRVEGRLLILGSRVMLFSRKGVVALEAEGFAPQSVHLDKNGERQQIQVALEPLPGIAVITVVSPVDFELSVDGTSFGATSRVEVELHQGPHSVRIGGGRVKPVEEEIDITGYGEIQLFEFVTEPGNSAFAVKTTPADAQVLLDGDPVGRGGYEGFVDLGNHEIVVKLDGYHDRQKRFTAEPEKKIDLGLIELSPKAATLTVASTPGGAAVLVDGDFAGSTPVRISLQPLRTHRLTIRKTGYEPLETRIEPAPGEVIDRVFRLGSHNLRANVTADIEARVTVNGVKQGVTPAAVTVREGDRIEVSRDGYRSQRVVVLPVGGDERDYAFKMMRPNEYAFRQAAAEISLANGISLRKFPPVHIHLRPANGQASLVEKELTRPFYMGLREVTYQEYLVFDPRPIPRGLSPGHPITNLTWAEAAGFCNWLSGQEGLRSRCTNSTRMENCAASQPIRWATGYRRRRSGKRSPDTISSGTGRSAPFPGAGKRPYPGHSAISPVGKTMTRGAATSCSTMWTTTRLRRPSDPIRPISTAFTTSRAMSLNGSRIIMLRSLPRRKSHWSTQWDRRGASTTWSKGRASAPTSWPGLASTTAPLWPARAIPSASA